MSVACSCRLKWGAVGSQAPQLPQAALEERAPRGMPGLLELCLGST